MYCCCKEAVIKSSSPCFKIFVALPKVRQMKEIMTRMGAVIDVCRCSAEVASLVNLRSVATQPVYPIVMPYARMLSVVEQQKNTISCESKLFLFSSLRKFRCC